MAQSRISYHKETTTAPFQGKMITLENKYKECFESLDLTEILKVQNICSQDDNIGYIWVLNTCVFFVAEYNFILVTE